MKQWHGILQNALSNGVPRADRTGVGTRAIFGAMLVFDNTLDQFPAVTTKELKVKPCFGEMAAFIQGASSLAQFHALGCHIWDANANAPYWQRDDDLGRIYGVQWRNWQGPDNTAFDQLANLVAGIKQDPCGRRHLVTAWNPGELSMMCLPPCHTMFQVFIDGAHLDLLVTMRSVDLFLGLPFDVAGFALLQRLLAKETDKLSRRLIFSLGDAHIYNNHLAQVDQVLSREPITPPVLCLHDAGSLFNFVPARAQLLGYVHHGAVNAPMAV